MKRSITFLIAGLAVIPLLLFFYAAVQVVFGFSGTFEHGDIAECGIVFGAAVHSKADPGPAILRRTNAGVQLYHAGRIERLIFTGGKGSEFQLSEAEVMRGVAIDAGVLTGAILLETKSSSTWENIVYSKPLLEDCTSFVGVSDFYHLARIELIAQKQGITLPTYPARPLNVQSFEIKRVVREIGGYFFYWLEFLP